MVYYEMKKIFVKPSNKVAVMMLFALLGIVSYLAIHNVEYVNERGETETGITAVKKLREVQQEWAGVLDEEQIKLVIEENARICATPEAQSEDTVQNQIAYGWKQGFCDIRRLLVYSFCALGEYDYYRADRLSPEDAGYFYSNRMAHLKEWLEGTAGEQFTEEEKAFLIRKYEKLQIPMQYNYSEGWRQLSKSSTMLVEIMVLILGFLVSGIFSSEFQLKADAIFYASRYGRDKAITARIKAGFLLVTGFYWLITLLHITIVLGILGADGGTCMLQTDGSGWLSFYNLTFWQEYVIIAVGGYVGAISILFFTMLVSAMTRSSVLAVIVPFVLLFIPEFLRGSKSLFVTKIVGLFPDMLLLLYSEIREFRLYQIGTKVMGAVGILFVLYTIVTILLCPLLYQVYRRAEG